MKSIEKPVRKFVQGVTQISDWNDLEKYFTALADRKIRSKEDLKKWFTDRSELEAIISEDLAWRYINMTRFTENEENSKKYADFVQNIQPKIAPFSDILNKKAINSEYLNDLAKESGFDVLIREMKKEIEIFREENIPIFTEIQTETQKYGQISGKMTIEHSEQELTLQQAAVFLQEDNRELRKEIYDKISARRLEDKTTLDTIFNTLIQKRTEAANNAGFKNFRDYMFKAMGRFEVILLKIASTYIIQ